MTAPLVTPEMIEIGKRVGDATSDADQPDHVIITAIFTAMYAALPAPTVESAEDAELLAALVAYQQADEEGVFVKVSREACDLAAARIRALLAERDAMEPFSDKLGRMSIMSHVGELREKLATADRDLTAARDEIARLKVSHGEVEALYFDAARERDSALASIDDLMTTIGNGLARNLRDIEELIAARNGLTAARAEAAALRRDAERYQWLRDCGPMRSDRHLIIELAVYDRGVFKWRTALFEDDLDRYVSTQIAAIAQERKDG